MNGIARVSRLTTAATGLIISMFFLDATSYSFAAETTEGEKLMIAAVISLGYLTIPSGKLTIYSESYAASTTGVTFRKLSDCVYGMEEGRHIEMVDFTGLTGAYRTSSAMVGTNLTFTGRKPRTRCFQMAGNSGCSYDLAISYMPPQEVQRVIDDVSFIQRTACPPAQPEPH